jgi:hypothetical protein
MTPSERNGSATGGGAERDPLLDRAYRAGAREEPPAHLDAAILAAARREVGARPRSVSARLRAWRVPVSIAAVVVLSVSLGTLVREEGGGKLEQPRAVDRYSRPAETAPAPPAAAPEAAKAPARVQPPAAAPAAGDDGALGATASTRIAGEAARREDQARAGQPAAQDLMMATPRPAAPSPQPFQAAPAAPERRPVLAADQAAGAGAATQSTGTRASEAEVSATPAEPASAPKAAARTMQRDRAATEDAAGSISAVRPPAAVAPAETPRPRAETRSRQTGPALTDTARVTALMKEVESQPPEKWLERIEGLKREGRKGEADDLLAEFKRRFPNHPLPPGLR